MSWEERSGKRYYYRKRRIGKRVVSEYIGRGPQAESVAETDALARADRADRRARWQAERNRQADIDRLVDAVCGLTRTAVWDALRAAGYHQHKGQWRKRRG